MTDSKPIDPLLGEILDEVRRAVHKFPTWPTDPIHAAAVLAEEVGELHKGCLELTYEPGKTTPEAVRAEAIDSAAMALRFLTSFDVYEFVPSVQHQQVWPGDDRTGDEGENDGTTQPRAL